MWSTSGLTYLEAVRMYTIHNELHRHNTHGVIIYGNLYTMIQSLPCRSTPVWYIANISIDAVRKINFRVGVFCMEQ